MNVPSIEAALSRKHQSDDTYPIARHLEKVPVLGGIVRAWVRATHVGTPRALWASLPPLAAA